MNSRERIKGLISRQPVDRCGFWLGHPDADTWPLLHDYFKTADQEELKQKLEDDFRWIAPWNAYQHPEGKPVFDMQRSGKELGAGGVFAECEEVSDVEAFDWPDPDYLVFDDVLTELRSAGDVYRAGGFWSSFFHETADFFGMENYFVKMYTHPEVVHAVTSRIVDYYLEANRRLFETVGDELDGFFFGNDFGTQLDLQISPELFAEFIFPYFQQLTELGHKYGYQVILHSCGAIRKVIPDLIRLGVDALHPLQARAVGMEAEELGREFGGQITFIGGVDTQDLLVNGGPEEVAAEVERLTGLLGPHFIISPSHEAVLPNVPAQNVEAMARLMLR